MAEKSTGMVEQSLPGKIERLKEARIFRQARARVEPIRLFYARHKKYQPVLFFFSGFLWDSLTLTRIDRLSDNLILLAYILLLAAFVLLLNLVENQKLQKAFLLKYSDWYPLAIQFFLGGLFSSYVVFYFKSASLTKDWLFLAILVVLLIANEFLEKRLSNITLQTVLFFLASFSFFIFFIPVMTGWMNFLTFFSGGVIGLLLTGSLLHLLYRRFSIINKRSFRKLSITVVSVFILLNFFYFMNWIPPVPLALKSAGIYHRVVREGDQYALHFKQPEWYQFWKNAENPFHYAEGDTVYCFASVFAPTHLEKKIFHRWKKYNERTEKWESTDNLGYEISGGREGGYRGYTFKQNVTPGKWRVEVITENNRIVGRIGFRIVAAEKRVENLKVIFR